ncbi:hypothetical protein B5F40_12555 [Gordonibacter sp. An230]|uniref:molybdopterin-containing oxidoreductase family protein n=1 Tax=Gordonibacter sp. An230 TaxID=1965592 RepID=UPI000B38565D|nr:molybdopterin-dependent oxidoreductase [Gordonibacter sp. An230]OUO88361.1 hypothetical protein B5F40_12555 [Gordonibacter sp. An230]
MNKTLTRRTFAKAMITAAAACTVSAHAPHDGALAHASEEPRGEVKRVRSCCRACGKMECGVWVTVRDGRVIRIEGDESAFQSEGNCCSKSQSSMQAAYHPDRLRYPMRRTRPKGEDPGWERISWDEALDLLAENFQSIKDKYGGEALFTMGGTSRVWVQCACYSSLNTLLETPNSIQALQICKGPRAFATALVNDFGMFWYEATGKAKVYVQWGTACEYSNYDSTCRTVSSLAEGAEVHIVVDPRMTPLGKEADYWLPIRVGTDGALAMAWTNIVIERDLYNAHFVKRWTNGACLVVDDMEPSGGFAKDGRGGTDLKTRLLKESDLKEGGSHLRFMVWDNLAGTDDAHPLHGNDPSGHLTFWDNEVHAWEGESGKPQTEGHEVPDANPRVSTAFLPDESRFDPDKDPALFGEFDVVLKDGRTVKARPVWDRFAEVCAQYTPERAAEITGVDAGLIEEACLAWATPIDPGSSYGNGGIHYQLATDQIGNAIQTERALAVLSAITNNTDVPGGNRGPTRMLGFNNSPAGPMGDTSLMRDPLGRSPYAANEKMAGGDKFPVIRWFDMWCDCASAWEQAITGEPYPLRGGICMAAQFINMDNSLHAYEALKRLEFFSVSDLWHTPTTEMADVLIPAAHWLEVDSPRMSQGPSGGIGATVKCVEPPGEARMDTELTLKLFKAMGKPWDSDPERQWYTLEQELDHDVTGMKMSWAEFKESFQEHGWFDARELSDVWHSYRRWETGKLRQTGGMGTSPNDGFTGFFTPTGLTEIWSTVIETYGDARHILPDYEEPPRTPVSAPDDFEEYPFVMTTGSRSPVYFHTEHRQLPWCRELWPVPRVEMNPADAAELGLEQGDWVWIENANGKVRQVVDLYHGIGKGTVNANHGWWFPEAEGPGKGFDLCNINMLVYGFDQDPLCGATTLRGFPVKVYKATPENSPFGNPVPCDPATGREVITSGEDERLHAWVPNYEGRE